MLSNHFLSPFVLLAPWAFCGSKLHNGIVCWVKTYFLWAVLSLSFFHKISDWLRSEGALQVIWSNHSAQAGPPRACFPGPCPDGFGITPRMESLQPPWEICASAWSLTEKTVSWYSEGTSCVSVCAYCLWSWHWAPLKRVWLQPLYNLPTSSYTHWEPFLLYADETSSLSLCSQEKCHSLFITLVALRWTTSTVFMSLLHLFTPMPFIILVCYCTFLQASLFHLIQL